jgi:hypothetical protein
VTDTELLVLVTDTELLVLVTDTELELLLEVLLSAELLLLVLVTDTEALEDELDLLNIELLVLVTDVELELLLVLVSLTELELLLVLVTDTEMLELDFVTDTELLLVEVLVIDLLVDEADELLSDRLEETLTLESDLELLLEYSAVSIICIYRQVLSPATYVLQVGPSTSSSSCKNGTKKSPRQDMEYSPYPL